jgi:hypothetical protein
MIEHLQDPDSSVAGAHSSEQQKSSVVKVLNIVQWLLPRLKVNQEYNSCPPLEALLSRYRSSCNEVWKFVRRSRYACRQVMSTELDLLIKRRRLRFSSDMRAINLDELLTLDGHNVMLGLSRKCLERQVEFNAFQRAMHTKLREILALRDEIMAYSASELDNVWETLCPSARAEFAITSADFSLFHLGRLSLYRRVISRGAWDELAGTRLP